MTSHLSKDGVTRIHDDYAGRLARHKDTKHWVEEFRTPWCQSERRSEDKLIVGSYDAT
jgi:hypothetical protein